MIIDDIDFGRLYREHVQRARRTEKRAADWDTRAPVMNRGVFTGPYVDGFLARLDTTGCRTLLDVGCGPGTIALSVADRLDHVYGLDYSPAMLEAFVANARARGIDHATPVPRAWEDDWDVVPACDIVVASRSTQVPDLEAALLKLHAFARRRVYVTHLVGGRFADPTVLRLLGRDDGPLPDYLYAVAILHRHGIHPRVDYLEGENRFRHCKNAEDFVAKVAWSLGQLSEGERTRLRDYYEERRGEVGARPMRWALISWERE